MPRFKWTVEFDADDDEDANGQVEDAKLSLHSVYSDDLIDVEEADN